ncbi:MAG: hypothetical protein ACI8P0_004599 [Planctomycetaceae bacterium]|jgi:hypothetical protein
MAFFARHQLKELIGTRSAECVSIYLSTHRAAPDSHENPIRFSNLLGQAEHQLRDAGLKAAAVKSLLKPAAELKGDTQFWTHQRDGLAVFVADGFFRTFRLPRSFKEKAAVDDHFHVAPLLPLLQNNGRYHVLAVSQNSCRLFSGDRDNFEELEVEALPDDLKSALGWSRERQLNLHSMQHRPQSRGGDDTAMYHGHEEDTTHTDLAAYFRKVDAALKKALNGDDAPVVFAGVEASFPAYCDVTDLKQLVETPLTGNPDDLPLKKLHQKSWAIVEPLFQASQQETLEDFGGREAHGTATDNLPTILTAARDGLVETLLITVGTPQWGTFCDKSRSTIQNNTQQDGDIDLIDLATLRTLNSGGEVLVFEPDRLPNGIKVGALLRAPVEAIAS